MRRWDALNTWQQVVLRRIAAGEDLGGPADMASRRSASALRDRGLVTITKRDGWRATLTDAGRYYIEHGYHPEHPNAPASMHVDRHGQAVPSNPTRHADPKINKSKKPAITTAPPRRTAPHRTLEIAEKRRAAATELITKLVSDGPFTIHNPDNDTITEWRRVIDFAKRSGLVPEGKRIVKNRPYGRHLKIELVEGAHPQRSARSVLGPADHRARADRQVAPAAPRSRGQERSPAGVVRQSRPHATHPARPAHRGTPARLPSRVGR